MYNEFNDKLGLSVEKLPKEQEMIPLYIEILSSTRNAIVRNEIAFLLSQICNDSNSFKSTLIDLLESPQTDGARGSLLTALSCLDYSDDNSIEVLCQMLSLGNYECMYKAFHMLQMHIDRHTNQLDSKLESRMAEMLETAEERLDMISELYEQIKLTMDKS